MLLGSFGDLQAADRRMAPIYFSGGSGENMPMDTIKNQPPLIILAACRRKEHRTRIFRINADLKQTFIKKSAEISAQSVRVPFGFSVASPTGS